MRKLRVVLVDDEIMIREGFKKLFDWGAHDCEVVGEAADGVEALGVIDSMVPDIVIMDINIPIMNGLKVIQTSRLKYPDMHSSLYRDTMIFLIAGKHCGCQDHGLHPETGRL